MEINSSLPMGQALFMSQVSISVQKMAMDQIQQSTEDLKKMLEQSVTPYLGSNFDMKG